MLNSNRNRLSLLLAAILCAYGTSRRVEAAPLAGGGDPNAAAEVAAARPAAAPAVADAKMRVHFINVGQGAATLFEFPHAAVLVDTGGESNGDFDSNAALDAYLSTFFARRNDLSERLTSLILTHPHIDHTRDVANVLAHYRPLNVVTNGQTMGSGGPQQVLAQNYAANHDGSSDHVDAFAVHEDQVPATGLTNMVIDPIVDAPVDPKLTVLWGSLSNNPGWSKTDFENPNNNSVVLRVDYGEASVLITGDLETPAIAELLQKFAGTHLLDVEVYEVGHHGSINGTTQALLDAITPDYAVMEVGNPEREVPWTAWAYGHPRKEVLALLDAAVAKTRPQIEVLGGKGAKQFEQVSVRKAIFATGWDGDVVLEAGVDGVFRVVSPGGDTGAGVAGGGLIDINKATADQLATLPRIGPIKAARIVDYRAAHGPFATVDDLDKVPGIGPATVEAVRPLVTVAPH